MAVPRKEAPQLEKTQLRNIANILPYLSFNIRKTAIAGVFIVFPFIIAILAKLYLKIITYPQFLVWNYTHDNEEKVNYYNFKSKLRTL